MEKAKDFDLAVHDLIKEYMTKHQRIIFNGNGYSDEWVEEAARRGLPNIKSMVEAVETLTTDKAVRLFEKFHIFTKRIFRQVRKGGNPRLQYASFFTSLRNPCFNQLLYHIFQLLA